MYCNHWIFHVGLMFKLWEILLICSAQMRSQNVIFVFLKHIIKLPAGRKANRFHGIPFGGANISCTCFMNGFSGLFRESTSNPNAVDEITSRVNPPKKLDDKKENKNWIQPCLTLRVGSSVNYAGGKYYNTLGCHFHLKITTHVKLPCLHIV